MPIIECKNFSNSKRDLHPEGTYQVTIKAVLEVVEDPDMIKVVFVSEEGELPCQFKFFESRPSKRAYKLLEVIYYDEDEIPMSFNTDDWIDLEMIIEVKHENGFANVIKMYPLDDESDYGEDNENEEDEYDDE